MEPKLVLLPKMRIFLDDSIIKLISYYYSFPNNWQNEPPIVKFRKNVLWLI